MRVTTSMKAVCGDRPPIAIGPRTGSGRRVVAKHTDQCHPEVRAGPAVPAGVSGCPSLYTYMRNAARWAGHLRRVLGQAHQEATSAAAELSSMYYSCCFSICDRAAAQRGSWFMCVAYLTSPPSGRPGSGHGGCQAGGVVVPAGAGLVASAPGGPAQLEGEAGAADGGRFSRVAGQFLDAAGLGG